MEANESLHALSNDVGTTSSGEDLAGIDCSIRFTSFGVTGVNSARTVPSCGLSQYSGVCAQFPSMTAIDDLISRTLLTKYSDNFVQNEALSCVLAVCDATSP